MHRQGSRNEDTVENKMDQVPTLMVLTFNKPVLSLLRYYACVSGHTNNTWSL